MKRNSGGIESLFRKHEAKKFDSSSSPSVVVDGQAETKIETEVQATTPPSPHFPSGMLADTYLSFECDPTKRIRISRYDVDGQDEVRRTYIAKGPFQSYGQDFR